MRFFPVGRSQRGGKEGPFQSDPTVLEEQKPEAAYFLQDGGARTAFLIVNMEDASQLAEIVEPWFSALNASVECKPCWSPAISSAFPPSTRAVKNLSADTLVRLGGHTSVGVPKG